MTRRGYLGLIVISVLLEVCVCSLEHSDLPPVAVDEDQLCHRVDYEVDFKHDLHLNFFLKPQKANIGDCRGHCSEVVSINSSNSNYYLLRSLLKDPSTPCCVPVEYEDLQVLIKTYSRKDQKFVTNIRTLQDAKVTKCACV